MAIFTTTHKLARFLFPAPTCCLTTPSSENSKQFVIGEKLHGTEEEWHCLLLPCLATGMAWGPFLAWRDLEENHRRWIIFSFGKAFFL